MPESCSRGAGKYEKEFASPKFLSHRYSVPLFTDPLFHYRPKVMVIDDSPDALELTCEILAEQGYESAGFQTTSEAIASLEETIPDLILLDAIMPGMDGYASLKNLREIGTLKDVPILFVSGVDEPFQKVKAFRLGAVDYLTKPFHAEELNARIRTHLRLSQVRCLARAEAKSLESLVESKLLEISESQMAVIFAMAKLSESRDYETGRHMERIQIFCKILSLALRENFGFGEQIDDQFLQDIVCTSALHDIGKVGIEDAILLKPGKLTVEEFAIMKRHSIIGAETLRAIYKKYPSHASLEMGIAIARSHHEKWDGSGYPDGLARESIPLAARIMALADVYDALRARRPYKEPFAHKKAVDIIRKDSGTHFDPTVVQAFLAREKEFSTAWDRLSKPV